MQLSAEFFVSIAAMVFGAVMVACMYRFGRNIYWWRWFPLEACIDRIMDARGNYVDIHALQETMEEYLGRRNKFWELFGQVTLSIVVVVLLAVLLLMDKIGPEAGLPILSALAAFVVGKGIGGPDRAGYVGRRGPDEK